MDKIRFLVALLFYITGVAWVRAWYLSRTGPLVRAVLVHHIKKEASFEKMIDTISSGQYNPISFSDLLSNRIDKKKINILLTMDDGYQSWFTKGLPILEKYNIPVVFFVSSGFIGCAGNADTTKRFCRDNLKLSWVSEPMNHSMLQKCSSHPLVTFGGHTMSHPFLTSLSDVDITAEIKNDKEKIEKMVGGNISIFAYPFGDYNEMVVRVAKDAGYSFAMTTRSNFCEHFLENPFVLARSNHGTVSPFTLRMWILGSYDIVFNIESSLKNIFR